MNLPWKRPALIGRELDPDLALLLGEAADQRIKQPEPRKGSPAVPVWQQVPSLRGEKPDYYHLPLLKEPVWIWSVPVYFHLGGIAGGSAVLAAAVYGKRRLRTLAAACRWLAFTGTVVGPALLTWDLGRRFRFINMLRTFRPTSPMSIGSWALAVTGMLASAAVLQGDRPGGRPLACALASGGLVVSGYTGVLLANTANPLWQAGRRVLPALFAASAIAGTAAALEWLLLNKHEIAVVERFGLIGKLAEAGGMISFDHAAKANPDAASALSKGRSGILWQGAKLLLVAGLAVDLIPVHSRRRRKAGSLLTSLGGLALRFALIEAGKEAAREPQAALAGEFRGH